MLEIAILLEPLPLFGVEPGDGLGVVDDFLAGLMAECVELVGLRGPLLLYKCAAAAEIGDSALLKKVGTVLVVQKRRHPGHASGHDVVDSSGVLDPQWSCHVKNKDALG